MVAAHASNDRTACNRPHAHVHSPQATRASGCLLVLGEAVPEDLHAVEHGHARADERLLAEFGRVVAGLELLPHVRLVLVLDLVVPGEERERQIGHLARLDPLEAGNQLLPEAGRRPVLHCERRTHRLVVVVAAVQPEQLVAEVQRARRAVPPLAEIVERQPQRMGEAEQPLEVRGLEAEPAAVHRAAGRHERRVASRSSAGVVRVLAAVSAVPAGVVHHAELVHQDFLRLAG